MKTILHILLAATLLFQIPKLYAWGYREHKIIGEQAVYKLPPELAAFYKPYMDYIRQQSVQPDKRRYCYPDEGQRHYINLDAYGEYPYHLLPHYWKDALVCYGEDILRMRGTLPWQISSLYYRLVEAFGKKDVQEILRLSAELGHYMADACVPLHTLSNYDGQESGQEGIHSLWESQLPEYLGYTYHYDRASAAGYVPHPLAYAWNMVLNSNRAADSVLEMERQLSDTWSCHNKYCLDKHGKKMKLVYSPAFKLAYNRALNGMPRKRMYMAITAVASLWMSAWVDAGQPDLPIGQPCPEAEDFQEGE